MINQCRPRSWYFVIIIKIVVVDRSTYIALHRRIVSVVEWRRDAVRVVAERSPVHDALRNSFHHQNGHSIIDDLNQGRGTNRSRADESHAAWVRHALDALLQDGVDRRPWISSDLGLGIRCDREQGHGEYEQEKPESEAWSRWSSSHRHQRQERGTESDSKTIRGFKLVSSFSAWLRELPIFGLIGETLQNNLLPSSFNGSLTVHCSILLNQKLAVLQTMPHSHSLSHSTLKSCVPASTRSPLRT